MVFTRQIRSETNKQMEFSYTECVENKTVHSNNQIKTMI